MLMSTRSSVLQFLRCLRPNCLSPNLDFSWNSMILRYVLGFLINKGWVNSPHISHCILPVCLGSSKSRICTMSACCTPVLDHVNKLSPSKNTRIFCTSPIPQVFVNITFYFRSVSHTNILSFKSDETDEWCSIFQGSFFGWNGSTFWISIVISQLAIFEPHMNCMYVVGSVSAK